MINVKMVNCWKSGPSMLTWTSMDIEAEGSLIRHCLSKNNDIIEDAIDRFSFLGTEAEAFYSTAWERSYSMGKITRINLADWHMVGSLTQYINYQYMCVSVNIYSEYLIAFSRVHTTPKKNAIQNFEIIVLYYVNSLQISDKLTSKVNAGIC